MIAKGISLRRLELFEIIARTGSVAKTSEVSGLSLPAVSQQLRNLEDSVGRPLLDHSRRPMQLTPAGRLFLRRTHEALRHIRQAQAEATMLELSHLDQLRMGVIEDFDSDITPSVVTTLAESVTGCKFRLFTRFSHELWPMLQGGKVDVAVGAAPDTRPAGVREFPLLRDPFVLAVPQGTSVAGGLAALSALPFLRYDRNQLMGARIEQHLGRLRIDLPSRFELDSNQSLHALVAAGNGWAVTTPLAVLRGQRFRDRIEVHPLPIEAFSRTISLFCGESWIQDAAQDLARTFRRRVQVQLVDPAIERWPWLAEELAVLED